MKAPNAADIIACNVKAVMHPNIIADFRYLMARIIATKKVLSPISAAKITASASVRPTCTGSTAFHMVATQVPERNLRSGGTTNHL